jgi:regulator of PEP synthase PpsR (kinase-PPPase family)
MATPSDSKPDTKQGPKSDSKQGSKVATPYRVILVSDGTGETAAQMAKAAMVQFQDQDVYFTRYKNVRTEAQIEAICEDAAVNKDLIVATLVSPKLRQYLADQARTKGIPVADLLGPLLAGLAKYFGFEPTAVAGLLHDVNESYFKRIDAMEYTIAHDDGKDLTGLAKADLIILGISRTSKTPLSMFLSHQGWIIGLTIDPESLATIRRNRLERLGQNRGGEYADPDKVQEEIEYANELFRKNRRWPVFNVTGKALEETASEIIKLMASRRLAPSHILELSPGMAPRGPGTPKS